MWELRTVLMVWLALNTVTGLPFGLVVHMLVGFAVMASSWRSRGVYDA